MLQYKVANRYSNALFTLAIERQMLDDVKKDIDFIRAVATPELKRALQSPVIRPDKKISIFKAVFKNKLNPLTISFFNLVFSKGRSVALNEIEQAFNDQYSIYKNIQHVVLTSAHPISAELKEELRIKVQNLDRFKGKIVKINERVDPELIGGFVLNLGDLLYDASIRNDLRHIKKQFIENMYIQNLR